jgi:hypothetical protein
VFVPLLELMSEKNFDFVCFHKTILKDFLDSCLKKIDPNKSVIWDWILAKVKSGGVLTSIKVDMFDVCKRIQGTFILQHNLEIRG